MPLVWISLSDDRPKEYRLAVAAGVRRALIEAFAVTPADRIHILTRVEPATMPASSGDAPVVIQVTAPDTRSATQKRAFHQRLSELLRDSPGIEPDALFLQLLDMPRENWFPGR